MQSDENTETQSAFSRETGSDQPNNESSTSTRNGNDDPLDNNSDATFIGWQESPSGMILPLYNVTVVGHPAYGSTVAEKTLIMYNLRVPQTPSPPEKE